jgi:excisionase family DNA binding protein
MKDACAADMTTTPKTLSVSQAAAICNVGRTTVGYWVRSKKLFARRAGHSFTIPVEDLLHFLASTGQPIPPALGNGSAKGPLFKSFRNCWTYWQAEGKGHPCSSCPAFKHQVQDCFCVRANGSCGCPEPCRQCRYFQEMFAARFQFIHQIDFPAAVFKGLSLWGGNAGWAELCGMAEDSLIGLGVESFVDPSSLAAVISVFKKAALGENAGRIPGPIVITTPRREKRTVSAWVFPLRDPEGANLILAGEVDAGQDGKPADSP